MCVGHCSTTLYVIFMHGSLSLQALFLLTILVGSVLAGPSMIRHQLHPMSIGKPVRDPSVDLCNLCIQFSSQFLNELVNIIASKTELALAYSREEYTEVGLTSRHDLL